MNTSDVLVHPLPASPIAADRHSVGGCPEKGEARTTPLSELQPGTEGQIASVKLDNPRAVQKLMAMGVVPGIPITCLRRFPSFVFESGYSQFAVDREIAAAIYVRLLV